MGIHSIRDMHYIYIYIQCERNKNILVIIIVPKTSVFLHFLCVSSRSSQPTQLASKPNQRVPNSWQLLAIQSVLC